MVYHKSYQKGNVSITEWDNETKPTDGKPAQHFKTWSVQKSYKNEKGEWINNATFTDGELSILQTLIDRVKHEGVRERGATNGNEE